MSEPIATQVFVPSDYPTYSYVQRSDQNYEVDLRNALRTPKTPVSVSGPSKTGKTALVQKIVGVDNLITVYGSQIREPEQLWEAVLSWIDAPVSSTSSSAHAEAVAPNAAVTAKIGAPGFSVGLSGGIQTTTTATSTGTVTTGRSGLAAVQREIGNTDYSVFIDDFHYIPRTLQEDIGKLIKSGSEAGIRFVVASVPHRSDDVVRSNHELRGRTANIDTNYWSTEDLEKIARNGFGALKIDFSNDVVKRLADEACTSPQLMQALCLELCFQFGIEEASDEDVILAIDAAALRRIMARASTRADHSTLVRDMHTGPRVRGTERKEFALLDGTRGDVYRACLLALAANPPQMGFTYTEILTRIAQVCVDDKPVGGSVTEALKQISQTASNKYGEQRIVEWDDETGSGNFSIIDPYFLFFLRSSNLVHELGKRI